MVLFVYSRKFVIRNVMKLSRKVSRIVWIVVSVIAVLGMIAFTLLPVIYYR